ncbi:MAG: hypothetical protein HQL43_10165 [Alphaproteobacteria bacterium]|nr:hypothetical protein [Alphaproteobacteria bacterium]
MAFQASPLPFLALFLGLAACAKPEPFVETPDLGSAGRKKALYEQVAVCFSDGDSLETLKKLAGEECAKGQKTAHYIGHQRWQCRLTVPHLASFACLDQNQDFNRKRYLPSQGTGLPPVDQPDSGNFYGAFGIGK